MPTEPHSPSPNFDFMLKDQPKTRRPLPLPNLPQPAKIILAPVAVLFLIISASSLLSDRDALKTQPFMDVLARGQETLRVTSDAQSLQLQDPQTQALAATVTSALTSDKQQLITYLQKNHHKVSAQALGADQDKNADTSLQSAAQNNNLDGAYVSYIRDALNKYENDLQAASKTAGPNGKQLLNAASISATTLLNSPPLKA